jgi:Flp pilus assembly protein TadG
MLRSIRNRLGERGSAAMELSMSLPVILSICAGVIEFGQAFHLRQNLVTAALEAARAGSQLTCPRPTTAEAIAAAAETLEAAGLDPQLARIALTNAGGEPGTDVVVRLAYDVYMPMLANLMHLSSLGPDGRLEVSVEIAAENE